MRALACPASLKGVLSASAAAEALASGFAQVGVVCEELRREAERIALAHFAVIRHVRLEAERRHAMRGAMFGIEPDPAHELVGGEIEDDHVIPHVHVAVVIDPLGPHDVAIRVERRVDPHGARAYHTTRSPFVVPRITLASRAGSRDL